MMAPHDGSNGPCVQATCAVHVMAAVPNFLILEHRANDVPWRYEVVTELPVVDGHIEVPRAQGWGSSSRRWPEPTQGCPMWPP